MQRASVDASHKKFSDKKLPEKSCQEAEWPSLKNSVFE